MYHVLSSYRHQKTLFHIILFHHGSGIHCTEVALVGSQLYIWKLNSVAIMTIFFMLQLTFEWFICDLYVVYPFVQFLCPLSYWYYFNVWCIQTFSFCTCILRRDWNILEVTESFISWAISGDVSLDVLINHFQKYSTITKQSLLFVLMHHLLISEVLVFFKL